MSHTWYSRLLLIALGVSLLISLTQSAAKALTPKNNERFALHDLAMQFVPIQELLHTVAKAGYYTDKNLDIPLALAQYQLAQFIVAPTILEAGNIHRPLVIIDCTSPQKAVEALKAYGLIPLATSPTGYIVAANPKGQP